MKAVDTTLSAKILNATVIVTALGYFVDMYDFFIFNVVRAPSLTDLSLHGHTLTDAGLFISNAQMAGLLVGSYVWGVLGDRYGRKSILFASITAYSLATFLCSFVHTVDAYAIWRFFAGFGIGGELGAGIALITEKLVSRRRGYGVAFFIILGFVGVIAASVAAQFLPWRACYRLGGGAGIVLLFARVLVFESGLYKEMAARTARRGGLRMLARDARRLKKYVAVIFIVAPAVFIPQIIWTLSPELAKAQGIMEPVKANLILGIGYSGVIVGDLCACLLSEKLRSRKKAILVFWLVGAACFLKYVFVPAASLPEFYIINGLIGFTFGVWIVGVALAAEQVGTNIRSTVATTVPNFARALTIPMNLMFRLIEPTGSVTAAAVIGAIIFGLALWGLASVDETYGRDLNFEET